MIGNASWMRVASLPVHVALSCGAPESPQDVARAFWEALRTLLRDYGAAGFSTTAGSCIVNVDLWPGSLST